MLKLIAASLLVLGLATAAQAQNASFSIITNPTSTLTLTSATTAYSAGQLVANNATAANVETPSLSIPLIPSAFVPRVRLYINDATGTAWGGVVVQVDLWGAKPTFTNGDRAAWAVATGSGSHLGAYSCTFSAVAGDGVYAECAPTVGTAPAYVTPGSTVFWTMQTTTGTGVTGASKVVTLTAELAQ